MVRPLLLWLSLTLGTLGLTVSPPAAAQERLVSFVDPFIGSDGTGHTFPGPSAPFGMVQPGPDNAQSGWDYTSGYQYSAPTILGFSQTRASGTGIPELGDVLVMPSAVRREAFASAYDKTSETARPGYYGVTLTDNAVRVELTASALAAFHRYTFEAPGRVWVLIDLQHGLTFRTDVQPVLESEATLTADGLEGRQRRTNWTTRTVAFSLQFDAPVADAVELPKRAGDAAQRYLLAFDLVGRTQLHMKAGMSTVDVAGARRNRETLAGWDFEAIAAATAQEWEIHLSRVRIEAPPRQRRIFYTALYHALLHPSRISDADGRWRGPDGVVRQAPDGRARYSTLSLWDTFRAASALHALAAPERVDDVVQTMLDHADAAGRLPKWTIWGGETGTMIGEPALPIIAEAWAKGFRGFDAERALAAMLATSTVDAAPVFPGDHALSTWSLYERHGYYPFDLANGEAVSRTLEAGIGDDAMARMAAMLGRDDLAARFAARSKAWRALVDPKTRLARGRDSNGRWRTPFDPLTPTSPLNNPGDYTEANAWQYSWTPGLFDPEGLVDAMGGRRAFRRKLDTFFFDLAPLEGWRYLGQEAMIGQYAHGNEPSHHVAWLYAWTDRPETGHALVRRIAETFYADTPNGLIGNEDAGQMSAWYVFATLGLYPAQPASATYVLGAPLVRSAALTLPSGARLEIETRGDGPRVKAVTLDGVRIRTRTITHEALAKGGRLVFQMDR